MKKLAALLLVCAACETSSVPTAARSQQLSPIFTVVAEHTWGSFSSWKLYVMRHQGGACFVVLDPPGEGGGAITQTERSVCASHTGVER